MYLKSRRHERKKKKEKTDWQDGLGSLGRGLCRIFLFDRFDHRLVKVAVLHEARKDALILMPVALGIFTMGFSIEPRAGHVSVGIKDGKEVALLILLHDPPMLEGLVDQHDLLILESNMLP